MYNKGDLSFIDKPKRVPWSVIEKIPEMIHSDSITTGTTDYLLSFHGGEPLLVGKEFFIKMMDHLLDNIEGVNLKYAIQTNAILVDEEWIEIFREFNIDVCASIDGPRSYNKLRVYHSGSDSTEDAVKGIKLLNENYDSFSGVICVVPFFANGKETVKFFIENLGLKWFDFLLPDFTHDSLPINWNDMEQGFTNFMISAFDEWYKFSAEGIGCRIFDMIIAKLIGLESTVDSIGRDGLSSVIIETNGYLEPHDALRICEGYDRSTDIKVGKNALKLLKESSSYLRSANLEKQFAPECYSCDVFYTCNGGNLLHRYSKKNQFRNKSVHCKTLKSLINHIKGRLVESTKKEHSFYN